ncbi:MAG: SusC/RagA family TonB-linked outer membrane protein, partial [Gemmatimonadetes bacterium]|nr:SusC/RagA family TonB-linked outer membrane protein [Gemmatimonadota bacterium]
MRWKWMLALSLLFAVPQAVFAQGGTITGLVTGSGERPLAGAAVTVQGTTLAVRTGTNGRYTLANVPAGARTVRASFAGHAEGTRQVTVAAGQTVTANVALSPQAVQLEGLVAIGYGTAARRDVTGSISSVRAEEAITRAAPTAAIATALQGRATGVQVVSNSGAPGAGVSVRVRGSNSISANSEPLYVIDGLPVAQGSSGTGNPLASIDTNEIESIEVLKDASSTSIYGARGANGVVLITTKRGQRGSNRVSIESSYGMQEISRNIPVMNSQEHMQFINETRVNRGLSARYSQRDMDTAKTYDYVGAITRRAPQMAHSLSFSGGDESTRYLLGGNFSQQEGIILGTNFERYGLRFNLDRTISSRFRIGNSLSLTNVYVEDAGAGNQFATATQYLPWVPFRDAEGNWVRDLGFVGIQGIGSNPLATVSEQTNENFAWRGIGSIFGEFDVTDALKIRSQLGGNYGFSRDGVYSPSTITQGFAVGGQANLNTNQSRELTAENLVTWRRELGPGNFDVLGGFSVQTSDFQSQGASGQTIPSDVLNYNALGQSASTGRGVSSNRVEWTLLSYLGRANYNLLDRYIFTVTGRRDGSSRFGANNKWAFFPSAAFAWRAIDEPFMQNQEALSDLKFRLSYGRTGNQAISEYQSLPQMQTQFYGFGTSSVERIAISPAAQSGNPSLKWETQDQLNVGFDLGVLSNRVSLSADAYQSTTSDLLLSVELPWTTGTSSQLRNVGAVRNRGVEFALNAIVWEGDRFNWRSTLNFAKNVNEVLKLAEGQDFFLPG